MFLRSRRILVLFLLVVVLAPISSLSYARGLPLSGRIRFHETEHTINGMTIIELEAEVLGWMRHHRFSTFPLVESDSFELGRIYRYSISDRSLVGPLRGSKAERENVLSQGTVFLYDRFHGNDWKDFFDDEINEETRLVNGTLMQEAFRVLEGRGGVDPELIQGNPFLRQILIKFGSLDDARKDAQFSGTRVRVLNIRSGKNVIQSFPVWVPKPDPVEPAVGFLPRVLGFGRNGLPKIATHPGGANVPDGGSTIALMIASLLAMAFGRRFFR